MEQIIMRRVLDGDERLFFLINAKLFVNPLAQRILTQIAKFYQEFLKFPTAAEVMFKNQSTELGYYLEQLLLLPTETQLSAEFLAHELKNQSARNLFVDSMLNVAETLSESSYDEISEELYKTSLEVRELSESSETIFNPADMPIESLDELIRRLPCGLDKFDQINGGFAPGELILIGGRRGTGKSIFALNILWNYYHRYDFSTVFFSIEMPKNEVYNRLLSIISGVPNAKIVKGILDDADKRQILRAKLLGFFDVGDPGVQAVLNKLDDLNESVGALEDQTKFLPKNSKQFFIVDDVTLSASKIDYYLSLLKQKSQAPICAICVDYLNIMNDPEADSDTDWKVQNNMSKRLKIIARQHKIITFSPNQIDVAGKARFATAIEDHIDCALKFLPTAGQKKAGHLPVFIDKMRNGRDDFEFLLLIDKENLQLKNLDESVVAPEGDDEDDDE